MHELPHLRMRDTNRLTPDRHHQFHIGSNQAFSQDALADHAGCAKQDNFH